MPRVEPSGDGTVRMRLSADEAELLRRLSEELRELLDEAPDGDLVMGRLFPPAYIDPDDAAAFRELTSDELQRHKADAIAAVTSDLGRRGGADVRLSGEQLDRWLAFLTDVRLAIGTRLDVDEELLSTEVDPSDQRAPALSVMHWVGWLQELLLQGLS